MTTPRPTKKQRINNMRDNSRRRGLAVPTTKHLEEHFGTHCPECGVEYDSEPGRKTCPTLQHWPDGRMTIICQRCNTREAAFRRFPLPKTNAEKREANRLKMQAFRTANPEHNRAIVKRSRDKHIDAARQRSRERYAANAEQIRDNARNAYAANREKYLEAVKRYYQANRDKKRAYNKRYHRQRRTNEATARMAEACRLSQWPNDQRPQQCWHQAHSQPDPQRIDKLPE